MFIMLDMNKERGLINNIVKLNILNELEYSRKTIEFINTRIRFYKTLLNHLEDDKPLFFQKKKLTFYNNKIKEYNDKIDSLYNELINEVLLIDEIYSQD